MMKRLALLVLSALWLAGPCDLAFAQSTTRLCFPTVITGSGKTSCVNVDTNNPLPTTATLSAAGGINVTVTNTVATAAVVTCANCATASVSGTLTVQNLAAGSNLNVLDTNSAALLSAVQGAIPAGTNAIGTVTIQNASGSAIGTVTVQNVNTSSPVISRSVPGTANGWTSVLLNGLTTTVTTVKNGAGNMAKLYCYNPNSSVAYVQVFNATPTGVTLGSTTPLGSFAVAATSIGGFGSNIGDSYSTAISVAATTTVKGLTAPSTALDCNVSYN